jgi:hypothetical protein
MTLARFVLLALCSVLSQLAGAHAYPSKPIALVVPFAAGGGTDIVARLLAERMRDPIKVNVVVENRAIVGGLRILREIYHLPAFGGLLEAEVLPGSEVKSDAELLEFARAHGSTVFHASGTAAWAAMRARSSIRPCGDAVSRACA